MKKGISKIVRLYITAMVLIITGSALVTITVQAEAVPEKITVPEEIVKISEELGKQYGICPEILQAMAWQESRFQAEAVNEECTGIMQVSEKWHRERMKRLSVTNLFDIKENMTVAADFLSELISEYGEVEIVLMKYNGDSGAQAVIEGKGKVSEYAENILELSARLERLHGK